MIFKANAKGKFLWVNEEWTALTGQKAEASLGDGWLKAVHPEDLPRVRKEWRNLSEHDGLLVSEYRFLRPEGAVRWALSRVTAERNGKGKIAGHIGVIVDVTELRETGPAWRQAGPLAGTPLTAREREVAGLLADGKTNREVAERLRISVRTAEAHRARIMRKLRIDSLAALVRYVLSTGMQPG